MAIVSGGVYIPFEALDLIRRPTLFRVAVIVVNALVVFYMLQLRMQAAEKRRAAAHKPAELT